MAKNNGVSSVQVIEIQRITSSPTHLQVPISLCLVLVVLASVLILTWGQSRLLRRIDLPQFCTKLALDQHSSLARYLISHQAHQTMY